MKLGRLVQAASITGAAVILMAASASASTIVYNTDAAGTGFGGTVLALNSVLGAPATLTFVPDANIATGIPSNVNLGIFTLVCTTCSVQGGSTSATFDPFSFDLVVTDVTDGMAMGTFVGTSTGGTVFSNVSPIVVNWAPLVLGPGTTNATHGNFAQTFFTTTGFTGIVAPNSGAVPGQSTVQGFVGSTAAPEPATLSLIGGGLFGLGLLGRKRFNRL